MDDFDGNYLIITGEKEIIACKKLLKEMQEEEKLKKLVEEKVYEISLIFKKILTQI